MTAGDNTIQGEGLGDLFKNLGNKGLNISKRWLKNPEELRKPALLLVLHLHPEALKQLHQARQK